jgi:hypothetical protein
MKVLTSRSWLAWRAVARELIAVSTGQPIDNIAVRIVRSRWWKTGEKADLAPELGVKGTSKWVPKTPGQW